MKRSILLFAWCVGLSGCGDAADGAAAAVDPPYGAARRASAVEVDFSVEPATVEAAQELCAKPPATWELTTEPAEGDYYGYRWVMCKPSLVITTPSRPLRQCGFNESMSGCGLPTVDGLPYQTWAFTLQEPERKTMLASFPFDGGKRMGLAFGALEHASGGFVHWLRLPLEPESAAELGTPNVVFVRVKNGRE